MWQVSKHKQGGARNSREDASVDILLVSYASTPQLPTVPHVPQSTPLVMSVCASHRLPSLGFQASRCRASWACYNVNNAEQHCPLSPRCFCAGQRWLWAGTTVTLALGAGSQAWISTHSRCVQGCCLQCARLFSHALVDVMGSF